MIHCPDCTARVVGRHLRHDDTCPLGQAHDQIQAEDRFWFALRPGVTERRRPAHWSEVAELRALGVIPPQSSVHGEVVVTWLADGLRTRSFGNLYWAAAA